MCGATFRFPEPHTAHSAGGASLALGAILDHEPVAVDLGDIESADIYATA
jgi:hypothetical protein